MNCACASRILYALSERLLESEQRMGLLIASIRDCAIFMLDRASAS